MYNTWTIGSITVTAVVESETPTSPRFLFDSVSKEDILERAQAAPWLKGVFVSDEGYLLQRIQCFIVDTGSERIAVDTCVGNDKTRHNPMWHQLQTSFLTDLSEAGYPPESITHVVCTHLHVDHVGWNTRLVDDQWVPTFSNARYVFVSAEVEHWSREAGLFDGEDVFADSVAPVIDAGQADIVGLDHQIGDNVAFLATTGHTPGHVSLELRSQNARGIITGDMTHTPIQIADPDLSSMFDTNPDEARSTRRRVFPDWADGETLVIGTHFGGPTAGTMVADGDGYRLEW